MTRDNYRDFALLFAAYAGLLGYLAYIAPNAWWFWFNTAEFFLAVVAMAVAFCKWRRA